jgi:putative PIN family toxin of toxin-antitoxin system
MTEKISYKIITDTNILISYLIRRKLKSLKDLFEEENIEIIINDKLIEEFVKKVTLPKFRNYFELDKALAFIKFLKRRATLIEVNSEITICRDSKDNFLLALAKDAGADFFNNRP